MKKWVASLFALVAVVPLLAQDGVWFTKAGASDTLHDLYLVSCEVVQVDVHFNTTSDLGGVVVPVGSDTADFLITNAQGDQSTWNDQTQDTLYFLYSNYDASANQAVLALIQGKNSIASGSYKLGTLEISGNTTNIEDLTDAVTAMTWSPASDLAFINTAGTASSTPTFTSFNIHFVPCGDVNGDGSVTVSDAIYLANHVFSGGPAPLSAMSGDVNGDGSVTVSDAIYLANHVFSGGPAPQCCPTKTKKIGIGHQEGRIQIPRVKKVLNKKVAR